MRKVELKVGVPHGEWMTVIVEVPSHEMNRVLFPEYDPVNTQFWRDLVCQLPGWTPQNIAFIHFVRVIPLD